jgi:hypothetical protein
MVMTVKYVAALAPEVSVNALDQNWADQLPGRVQCRLDGWCRSPRLLSDKPQYRLDWGAIAFELEESSQKRTTPAEDPKNFQTLHPGEKRVG